MVEILKDDFLSNAEREGRFQWHETEFHLIETPTDQPVCHKRLQSIASKTNSIVPYELCTSVHRRDSPLDQQATSHTHGILHCAFQRTRPQHISGESDILPFQNVTILREVFTELDLPSSYLLIASGSPAACQSQILCDKTGNPARYELTAHCVTKRGDWAMALSHTAGSGKTAVFWSVDDRIDSDMLMNNLEAFEEYAFHPMLVPCIMFAETLRMNKDRRSDIKNKLRNLEYAVRHQGRKRSFHASELDVANLRLSVPQDNFPELFIQLNSCRRDQESQEGRRELWRAFHEAIEEGFGYAEAAVVDFADDKQFRMHYDLKSWSQITWKTLQSLHARDEDHIRRVNHVADELGNIIQQRETWLHASIARAAQRDSEDMKFIAVLGSIFLPASLIATIFNIPQFQFLPGAKLFGVYLGITAPLIGVIVLLCFRRSRRGVRQRWLMRPWPRILNPTSETTNERDDHLAAQRTNSTFTASIV